MTHTNSGAEAIRTCMADFLTATGFFNADQLPSIQAEEVTKNGGKGIELTISSLTAVVDTADTNEKSAVYTFFSGKLFSAFSTAMKEIRKNDRAGNYLIGARQASFGTGFCDDFFVFLPTQNATGMTKLIRDAREAYNKDKPCVGAPSGP